MTRPLTLMLVCAILVGCAGSPFKQTIADLAVVEPDLDEASLDGSLGKAMQSYREFLDETPEHEMAPEAMRRLADLQIERGVKLGIVELHQDVVAGDPEVGGPERDEGRDVEAPHPDDRQAFDIGRELQGPAVAFVKSAARLDADARQKRQNLFEDPPARQSEYEI